MSTQAGAIIIRLAWIALVAFIVLVPAAKSVQHRLIEVFAVNLRR